MAASIRLRAVVRGDVQGVGFRYGVWRLAWQLGLTGFARNTSDGSVHVEAEGSPEGLDQLEAYLHTGPRFATVSYVHAERAAATGEFDGFEAR
ncbi:MAG TPA: acylphosphatase [Actinomycetes bacterium]|nr:acylphosphatase [Actinomycetes bacterium]